MTVPPLYRNHSLRHYISATKYADFGIITKRHMLPLFLIITNSITGSLLQTCFHFQQFAAYRHIQEICRNLFSIFSIKMFLSVLKLLYFWLISSFLLISFFITGFGHCIFHLSLSVSEYWALFWKSIQLFSHLTTHPRTRFSFLKLQQTLKKG